MNMAPASLVRSLRRLAAVSLTAASLLTVRAQQAAEATVPPAAAPGTPAAPAATPAAPAKEAPIVLSPFTVSASEDTGYEATNSIGGTKMDTPIKDLPFTIGAITSDFMHDIGAESVFDALSYSPGVTETSVNDWTPLISVRGFPATILRDGLTTYMQPSLAMADRIEVLEGASAIAYGQTAPGGVVNVVTKEAEPNRRFGSLEQIFGQWGDFETRFDYNEPIASNTLAVRISGSVTDQTTRRDDYHKTGTLVFPELTWRPSDRTEVSVQFARDQSHTVGLFAGMPADYANSTAGFSYLNQNYTKYYNGFTSAQQTLYGLPAPSSLEIAQVGGPAPIFQDNPYTLNPTGGTCWMDQTRYDTVAKLQQVIVSGGSGVVERSDLQVTAAHIYDSDRGLEPMIDGEAPQGIRGYGVYSSDDFDATSSNPANWSGALWDIGYDYSGTVNAAVANQAGYYAKASEAVPGAKNMAGSCYYYTPDLTLAGMNQYVPTAGPDTFEWSPVAFHLELVNESVSADDVTTFRLGPKSSLRLLVGAERGRQRYWDYGRKGDLPTASGTSVAAQAQNYLQGSSCWSSTSWGPACGNGFWNLPNWGYNFTGFGLSNPGTLWGSGANRAYRGWYLWNADTGQRSAAQITGADVLAICDEYFYGLSQQVDYSAAYSTAQLNLLNDVVSVLGAVRYSDVEKDDYRVYGNVPDFPQRYHPCVPQVGVIWNITPAFNLYTSYSENYYYQWSRQTNILNQPPPIVTGNTTEFGSKFVLMNGRLSGSAAIYESNFKNLTYTDYTFDLTQYNSALYPALPTSSGTFVDQYGLQRFNGATRTRGQELNLQYRLTEDWDLIAQYSHMVSKFVQGSPWMMGLEAPGVPPNTASLWNKVSFKRAGGWLGHFAVGAGAIYKSPAFVGSPYNNEGAIVASSYYWRTPLFIRYDAFAGCYFKCLGEACALTLNVKNLANRTNWTTDGTLVPDGQGREFTGSFKVTF